MQWAVDHQSVTLTLVCSKCDEQEKNHTLVLTFDGVHESAHAQDCTTPDSITYTIEVTQEKVRAKMTQPDQVVFDDENSFTEEFTSAEEEVLGHQWTIDGKVVWGEPTAEGKIKLTVQVKCLREKESPTTLTLTFDVVGIKTEATCEKNSFTTYNCPSAEEISAELTRAAKEQNVTLTAKDTAPDFTKVEAHVVKDMGSATGHSYKVTAVEWPQEYSAEPQVTVTVTCVNTECGSTLVQGDFEVETTAQEGKVDATCTSTGKVTFELSVTYQGKTLEFAEGVEQTKEYTIPMADHQFTTGNYKQDPDNPQKHVQQCANCSTYGDPQNHVYTNQYAHNEGTETHTATCDLCNGTEEQKCTPIVKTVAKQGQTEICPDCKHDYAETVTVHFKSIGSFDTKSLRLYAFNAETNTTLLGEWANAEPITENKSGWYTKSFNVSRGHIGYDLFVIVHDADKQTQDIIVESKDVWINGYENAAIGYTTQNLANDAAKTVSGKWVLCGDFNDWKEYAGFAFDSNNTSIVLNLKAGREFKFRKGENWQGYGSQQIKVGDQTLKSFASNSNNFAKSGDGKESGNIHITRDCRLKFTVSNDTLTITIIKLDTLIEKHEKGTEHLAQGATCASTGTVQYWECKFCGIKLDSNGNVLTDLVVPATGAHNYQLDTAKGNNKGYKLVGGSNGTASLTVYLMCSVCSSTHEVTIDGITAETHTDADCETPDSYTYTNTISKDEIAQKLQSPCKLDDDFADIILNETVNGTVPALKHNFLVDKTIAWDDGKFEKATLTLKCSHGDCDKTITVTVKSTNQITDPTCTTGGHTIYTATIDQGKISEEIQKQITADLFTLDATVEKSYTLTSGEQDVKDALGHTWTLDKSEGHTDGYTFNGDISGSGKVTVYLVCQTESAHKVMVEIAINGEHSDATCEAGEVCTYNETINAESFKGKEQIGEKDHFVDEFSIAIKETVKGEGALGHSWVIDEQKGTQGWVWDASATSAAVKLALKCNNGEKCTNSKTLEVTNLTVTTGEKTPSTCSERGYQSYSVSISAEELLSLITDGKLNDSVQGTLTSETSVELEIDETAHKFKTEYTWNGANGHYQECEYNSEHRQNVGTCNYESNTKSDDTHHWKECDVCHHHYEEASHDYTDSYDQIESRDFHTAHCACGKTNEEPCTAAKDWQTDNDYHWHNCQHCGGKIGSTNARHSFDETSKKCSECNAVQQTIAIKQGDSEVHNVATLADAIQWIVDKNDGLQYTIFLNAGCTAEGITVGNNLDVILDLNGKAYSAQSVITVESGATLTIKNGSIGYTAPSAGIALVAFEAQSTLIHNQGKLVLDGAIVSSEGMGNTGVAIQNDGSATLNVNADSTVRSVAGTAIKAEGGTVTIASEATVTTETGTALAATGASVTNSGTISATGEGTAIKAEGGSVSAIGGTVMAESGKALDATGGTVNLGSATVTGEVYVGKQDGGVDLPQVTIPQNSDSNVTLQEGVECGSVHIGGDAGNLAHNWTAMTDSNVKFTWDENQHTASVTFTCPRCGYTETKDANSDVEITSETKNATCTTQGSTTYKATVTGPDNKVYTDSSHEVEIPAIGHNWQLVTQGDKYTWSDYNFDKKTAKLTVHYACGNENCPNNTKDVEFVIGDGKVTAATCTTAQSITFAGFTKDEAGVREQAEGTENDKFEGVTVGEHTYANPDAGALGHNWVVDTKQCDQGFDWTVEDTQATVKVYLKCEKESEVTNSITLTFTLTGDEIVVKDATCAEDKTITVHLNKRDAEQRSAVDQDYQGKVQTQDAFPTLDVTKVQTEEGSHLKVAHTFGDDYFDNKDGNHYRICSVCEAHSEFEEHTWSENYTSEGSKGHYRECTKCHAHNESKHTLTWVSEGAATHYQKCENCDYKEASEAHGQLTWVTTSTQHYQKCAKCDYKTTAQNHTFTYTNNKSAKNHSISCSVCHFSGGEEKCDSFLDNNMCGRCGGDYRNTNGYTEVLVVVGSFAGTAWSEKDAYKLDYSGGNDPHYFLHIHFNKGDQFKIRHWGDTSWSQQSWGFDNVKQCTTSSGDVDKKKYFSRSNEGNIVVSQNMTVYIDLYQNNDWLKLYIELD